MIARRIQVRHAEPEDADALAALQAEIYGERRWFVGNAAPEVAALRRRLEKLDSSNSLLLIAACETVDPAGWLELHRLQPLRMNHVAVLTLAVAKRARRSGIGRRLMREACAWAKAVAIEKITLSVRAGNLAAIELYFSEGFSLEGREVRQLREGSVYEDNLLMAKFLD